MNNSKTGKALGQFKKGYNCSQSVLTSFSSELGLDDDQALRLAAPFGGGFGHRGEICGAVSGAMMVIGLKKGYIDPQDKAAKHALYDLAGEFQERFVERQGTIHCRDLLGVDISSPDQLELARETGVFKTRCPNFVQSAVEILEDMFE